MKKQEVEWAAWDYYQNLDSHHKAEKKHCNNITNAFEDGAEWAQKFIIDKAHRWLKENAHFYISDFTGTLDENKLIEDFKKAMEE